MKQEVAAWTQERNQKQATVSWCFKCADARVKLKRLDPLLTCQN